MAKQAGTRPAPRKRKRKPTVRQQLTALQQAYDRLQRDYLAHEADVTRAEAQVQALEQQLEGVYYRWMHAAERLQEVQLTHFREILAWVVELARVKREPVLPEFADIAPPPELRPDVS